MRDLLAATAMAILMLSVGGVSGCASSEPQRREVPPPKAAPPPASDANVPPEKLEEIDNYFRRKAGQLQYRCYDEVVEKTQQKYQGSISVAVVVIPGGKVRDVKIVSSTIPSPALEKCVLGEVQSWDWPDVPGPAPYVASINFKPAW